MPYFIKIDFRPDGTLGAWHSRDEFGYGNWTKLTTNVSETRVRDVLLAIADDIDPEGDPELQPVAGTEGEK